MARESANRVKIVATQITPCQRRSVRTNIDSIHICVQQLVTRLPIFVQRAIFSVIAVPADRPDANRSRNNRSTL
jgi:hypothetical protein